MIREPKQKILVSFSGGETSAYMINWLLLRKPGHDYKFVFANTGEENEETLLFVKQVADHFNIEVVWLEFKYRGFKVVDFETAYRSHDPEEKKNKWPNHPFREYIAEYGIPSSGAPNCSKDLKERIITRYIRSIGWKRGTYDVAIGIRADEIDRIGEHYYPLVSPHITKPIVNAFWKLMPFRLQLKGYQGNCKTCWKKSIRKLVTLYRESPEWFEFFKQMEIEYGNFIRPTRIEKAKKEGREISLPLRFFRENRSVDDIAKLAQDPNIENAEDDSTNTNYQVSILHDGTELDMSDGCVESCEVFT